MSESGRIAKEVEAVVKLLAEIRSRNLIAVKDLAEIETAVTRICAGFAVRALDSVGFHHLDEDLSEGRMEPRFVPIIKSVEMADDVLFPAL